MYNKWIYQHYWWICRLCSHMDQEHYCIQNVLWRHRDITSHGEERAQRVGEVTFSWRLCSPRADIRAVTSASFSASDRWRWALLLPASSTFLRYTRMHSLSNSTNMRSLSSLLSPTSVHIFCSHKHTTQFQIHLRIESNPEGNITKQTNQEQSKGKDFSEMEAAERRDLLVQFNLNIV